MKSQSKSSFTNYFATLIPCELDFRFTGQKKTNLKASTKTRTFSTKTIMLSNDQLPLLKTHCKTITSLVPMLDCRSLPMMPLPLLPVDACYHRYYHR